MDPRSACSNNAGFSFGSLPVTSFRRHSKDRKGTSWSSALMDHRGARCVLVIRSCQDSWSSSTKHQA